MIDSLLESVLERRDGVKRGRCEEETVVRGGEMLLKGEAV